MADSGPPSGASLTAVATVVVPTLPLTHLSSGLKGLQEDLGVISLPYPVQRHRQWMGDGDAVAPTCHFCYCQSHAPEVLPGASAAPQPDYCSLPPCNMQQPRHQVETLSMFIFHFDCHDTHYWQPLHCFLAWHPSMQLSSCTLTLSSLNSNLTKNHNVLSWWPCG